MELLIFFSTTAFLGLAFVVFWRKGAISVLYTDHHLRELRSALGPLREDAVRYSGGPTIPGLTTKAPLMLCYSVQESELGMVHHLSISTPVSPASAVGTFFMAYAEALLRLEDYPGESFVSENRVFHLIRVVPLLESRALHNAPLRSVEEALQGAHWGRRRIAAIMTDRRVST